jgi:hypothetical protein
MIGAMACVTVPSLIGLDRSRGDAKMGKSFGRFTGKRQDVFDTIDEIIEDAFDGEITDLTAISSEDVKRHANASEKIADEWSTEGRLGRRNFGMRRLLRGRQLLTGVDFV